LLGTAVVRAFLEPAERRCGGFVRTVPLPPGLALDGAEARVKRGVLTVTIPKATERPGTRHIPIGT
jgi:HSP20 family molecular chaperone IbpA